MHAASDPVHDAREAGRVVASVALAAGPLDAGRRADIDAALARMGAHPLVDRDLVVSTPEELAPSIPPELREPLADLLLAVAGAEPLCQRVAWTYLTLWRLRAPAAPATGARAPVAERVARRIVGPLPRHQGVDVPEERAVQIQPENAYRSTGEGPRGVAPPVPEPMRARVARIQREMHAVVAAVDRVVIGKHDAISRVLTVMAAGGHVLLVDAPGVGKTQLCKAMAAALGARFGRVQFTPDLLPMDITGGTVYEAHAQRFTFRPGPVFTHFLLADEINRATPKTQSALLEVMEERTVTVDGTTYAMAEPFQVLATMNPLDHDGTFALPAAQIDRFMAMLELGYPSPEDEVRVLDTHLARGPARALPAAVVDATAFLGWQATVPLVHVSPEVKRAAVAYVNGLRQEPSFAHAVSPRATLAWVRAAQARALYGGREFVAVEDLLDMAPDVLRHRLSVTAGEVRARLRGLAPRGAQGAGA